MSESKCLSTQQQTLRSEWPRTTQQLESTYFTNPTWACTRNGTQNDAGYILWGLRRYASAAHALLPNCHWKPEELDLAAGREVQYQWARGRQFRSVPAALSSCWYNLVAERPIRLDQARHALAGQRGAAKPPMQLFSTVRSTETHSSFSGRYPRAPVPCLTESDSQGSMPPRCDLSPRPEQ